MMNPLIKEHDLEKKSFSTLFSLLNETEKKLINDNLTEEKADRDSVIFEQEISLVDRLFILKEGRAAYYYVKNNAQTMTGETGPGDDFGGISILFNDSVSVRTFVALEACTFQTLTADKFLKLCESSPDFSSYFMCGFGRCMMNKAFAKIIARQARSREFSLPFFNRPIRTIFKPNIYTCTQDDTIAEAAGKMSEHNSSAILIKKEKEGIQGIVTDADLRKKALGNKMDLSLPVSQIMSSPVSSISADCQVFEAFLNMNRLNKRHLAVHGQAGNITGIISEEDLINAQADSTYLLIKTVISASDMDEISNIHSKLEKMLLDPIQNGANPEYITRLITTFSDAIIDKVIHFSLEETGPPPCRFVFLTMGSEGRGEQTLISDQDNAIIFEDCENLEAAKKFFDHLSELICDKLHLAGYTYCDGNNMAKNPDWCQPLSRWKAYFEKWVQTPAPEHLLNSSIFFDFRGTWGDLSLADQLKDYLHEQIRQGSFFLRALTENALTVKPPLSMFGKIITETEGEAKGSINIKKALLPIIDFSRIFALENSIPQTNTLTRLFRLYTRNAVNKKEYNDILRAYNYMMRLRFLRQITTIIDEEKKADNNIYLDNLSAFDHTLLKEIFRMTDKIQQKLKSRFARSY